MDKLDYKLLPDAPDEVVIADSDAQPLLSAAPPLLVIPAHSPGRSCVSRTAVFLLGAFYLCLVLPVFCTFVMLLMAFDDPPKKAAGFAALCVVVYSGVSIFMSFAIGGIMIVWQALKSGPLCQNAFAFGTVLPIAHFAFFLLAWLLAVAIFGVK